MEDLIRESFKQNPDALQKLLETGNATLTHTQDKSKWGKLFPAILMDVREELREKESPKSDQPKVKKTNMFQSMGQVGLDPETLAEMKAEHTEAEAQQESTTTSVFGGLSNSTDNSELLEEMKTAAESVENTSSEGEIDLSLFEGYKGATDGLKNNSKSNPKDTSEDNEFKENC